MKVLFFKDEEDVRNCVNYENTTQLLRCLTRQQSGALVKRAIAYSALRVKPRSFICLTLKFPEALPKNVMESVFVGVNMAINSKSRDIEFVCDSALQITSFLSKYQLFDVRDMSRALRVYKTHNMEKFVGKIVKKYFN